MGSLVWIGFVVFILIMIALDIGVFHKKDSVIGIKESLLWTLFWIILAMAFNVFIYYAYEFHWLGIGTHLAEASNGKEAALNFFTGYLIEKSLSIDNLFVIALIFTFFKIPLIYQHRILFWGIMGALVFRAIMIGLGAFLVAKFYWINYIFGALLIYTAVKMLIAKEEEADLSKSPIVRWMKKIYPVSTQESSHFFVIENGKKAMTSLFLALCVVEISDVFFAVDSIPAIFAITKDPFIVFTSNVFAILGLRSLYFSIATLMENLRYLKVSLIFLLAFIGTKLILSHHYHIPTVVSLGIIFGILSVGILASVMASKREAKAAQSK